METLRTSHFLATDGYLVSFGSSLVPIPGGQTSWVVILDPAAAREFVARLEAEITAAESAQTKRDLDEIGAAIAADAVGASAEDVADCEEGADSADVRGAMELP
jgi:hypothetical protein